MCQNIFYNVIWCAIEPISKLLESLKHVVSNGPALVGKVVQHFCYLDEEDKQDWHRGEPLAMSRKDKF